MISTNLFFDKIDQIEIDITNRISIENIVENYNIPLVKKDNFKFSSNIDEIEKKIFELKGNDFDIFESGNNYILYKIEKLEKRRPDLNDKETKSEILELIFQKNKFDYNSELLKKISNKNFDNNDFIQMGKNQIQTTEINSIKDNKKFQIEAVKVLYSMPENSFTLINDEKNEIFLAKVNRFIKGPELQDKNLLNEYINKENSNLKNTMLKSYDLYLNKKYEVDINQKTIERVKNFFK